MTTYTERIDRDTSTVSRFNSESLSKEMVEMNKKIYDYLNKQQCYGGNPNSFEGHLSTLFEGYEFTGTVQYPIKTMGTLNLYAEEYPDITEIEEMIELCTKLLNVEEQEYDLVEPIIVDDYGVEGVSIECREAEMFHNKLMELRKKYGVTE